MFYYVLSIYLFMAVLGLRFCARAFSNCGKWRPLFIAVRGPLTIAASLVVEHRLQMRRLNNCGSQAQLLHGTWYLPRPGLEPVSPALAGRLSTTAPPGKPYVLYLNATVSSVILAQNLGLFFFPVSPPSISPFFSPSFSPSLSSSLLLTLTIFIYN